MKLRMEAQVIDGLNFFVPLPQNPKGLSVGPPRAARDRGNPEPLLQDIPGGWIWHTAQHMDTAVVRLTPHWYSIAGTLPHTRTSRDRGESFRSNEQGWLLYLFFPLLLRKNLCVLKNSGACNLVLLLEVSHTFTQNKKTTQEFLQKWASFIHIETMRSRSVSVAVQS